MGFSPGDFTDATHGLVHWELKDGPRIVLWSDEEDRKFINVEGEENIRNMFYQLQTLAMMLGLGS